VLWFGGPPKPDDEPSRGEDLKNGASTMRAGKITLNLPYDPIRGSAVLRVELLDDAGNPSGHVDLDADELGADERQREAVDAFAFNVEEAPRKADYIKCNPDNFALAKWYWDEDLYEWMFRRRRGRKPYEGLGDEAIRNRRMNR